MQIYALNIFISYIIPVLECLLEGLQELSALKETSTHGIGSKRIKSDYNRGHITRQLRTGGCKQHEKMEYTYTYATPPPYTSRPNCTISDDACHICTRHNPICQTFGKLMVCAGTGVEVFTLDMPSDSHSQ